MICLVVTGEYQASRQVSPVQALWSTRYGVFLLVKVALVAVMLAAALLAERHVMGAAVPGRLVRAVRRSVGIEIVTAILVLAVTAVLVSEPPARTTFGPPVTLSAPLGADHVSVRIDTTRRGAQAMTLHILTAAGAPVPARTVTATLSSAQVAALRLTLRRLTAGRLAVGHQRRGRPAAGGVDAHPRRRPRPGRRVRHLRQLPGLVTAAAPPPGPPRMAECLSWAPSCTSPRCDGGSFLVRGSPIGFESSRRRCRGWSWSPLRPGSARRP